MNQKLSQSDKNWWLLPCWNPDRVSSIYQTGYFLAVMILHSISWLGTSLYLPRR